MIKTISLTEFPTSFHVVPKTFHVIVDKIEYIIEKESGSTVVFNNTELEVIEPAEYILKKLNSFGDFND